MNSYFASEQNKRSFEPSFKMRRLVSAFLAIAFAPLPAMAAISGITTISPIPTWTTALSATTTTAESFPRFHRRDDPVQVVSDMIWPTAMLGGEHTPAYAGFKALTENATEDEIRWQPVLDYDKDSCYNQPAINLGGVVNEGLSSYNTGNTEGEGCRRAIDLDNQNVYVRKKCTMGWCAYMYEHYWRKDVEEDFCWGKEAGGHRHEWENAVVFVKQGDDMPTWVSTEGGNRYNIRHRKNLRFVGTHVKLVYHKAYVRKHFLRFAEPTDDHIENHKGIWMRGALIGWNNWPDVRLRDKMIKAFSGVESTVRPKLNECFFSEWLHRAASGKIKRYEPRTWECKLKGGANDKFTPWERIWSVLFNSNAAHPA